MTATLNAQHGARMHDTYLAIRNREPFKTHGALAGGPSILGHLGMLGHDDREQWYADVNDVDYVVTSYATPIAWHTPRGWHVVAQRFSATTSRHQSTVSRALGEYGAMLARARDGADHATATH